VNAKRGAASIGDEEYLLGLLLRRRLLAPEQVQLIRGRKEEIRNALLKQAGGKKKSAPHRPGLPEVIAAMKLAPASGGEPQLTEEMITQAVAADQGLPFKKLDPLELDMGVVTKTIPKNFALKHLVLPFGIREGELEVAVYDPDCAGVLTDIERVTQLAVKPYLATKSDILRMLAEFFGFQSSISAAESSLAGPSVDLGNLEQYVRIAPSEEAASTDRHISAAVDHLFNYAFEQRASDIHIEPKREKSVVRLRIDGSLHTIYRLPRVVHGAVVSRIKSLSRLDIAEKRRPQDGRIKVNRGGKEAEIRVSTVPVAFGEKVVLRILDPEVLFQDIEELGLSERDFSLFQEVVRAPHGIFLVTGPTGSGKTTTLYSTLKAIASPEVNVVTVEDPVEMVHEEFNQISVQPQVGVTFASILRTILRQDPDVIMIGEIRDRDTAENAIQAALTGHLVFSTLHTNDAVSSVSRLLDLGVQPFLVGATLLGAMAQRLARKVCPSCAETFFMDIQEARSMGFAVEDGESRLVLKRGRGCRECRNTGFLGRTGIFELFTVDDALRRMISSAASEPEIRDHARAKGMRTLREDAWAKVLAGVTTVEEALRVTAG